MGLFKRKSKKVEPIKNVKKEQDKELSIKELDQTNGGIPTDRAWCPRVDDLEPIIFREEKKEREEDKEIDER